MSSFLDLEREGGWLRVFPMNESWRHVRANQKGFASMYVLCLLYCCFFGLSTDRVSCLAYQRRLAVVKQRRRLAVVKERRECSGLLVIVRLRSNYVMQFRFLYGCFQCRVYGLEILFFGENCALNFVKVKLLVISVPI